ncbi:MULTISPECIES: glycosyltransferase family 2 protein [unclassified Phaeobacter]|uniref:glycosyltransferase family 2 protein n=1 Tax=unclassified Phaeobacter TaxID=2621772 RepID=UPI003A8A85BA
MTGPERAPGTVPLPEISLAAAYRLRWQRRRLLWRSFRSRHQLTTLTDRTRSLQRDAILAITVLRNEATRLPFFLAFYRDLGVDHFLIVDNGSDDGSAAYLAGQPDVSLWHTGASYRDARFGLDWATWLQIRYGHRRWCLSVDADELLVFGGDARHGLRGLTDWLDRHGRAGFGALMLDLFPKGSVGEVSYVPGDDPRRVLPWFDTGPYRRVRQAPRGNLWVQGGIRERMFFPDEPQRGPTLNKVPLVKWHRSFAYTNSTHAMLPRRLNALYDGPGGAGPSGVLLHSKFLPEITKKAEIEKRRGQHFSAPELFDGYYNQLAAAPDLWHSDAIRYQGPDQLEALGLARAPDWDAD